MRRTAATIVLEVLLTIALSLLLLTGWQAVLAADLLDGLSQGAYLLFFFNDVAILVWVLALVVMTVRTRRVPGVVVTLAAALLGVLVNVAMVTAIGFVQQGWFAFYVLFALEGGLAFLIAVLIVVPLVQRLTRRTALATIGTPDSG